MTQDTDTSNQKRTVDQLLAATRNDKVRWHLPKDGDFSMMQADIGTDATVVLQGGEWSGYVLRFRAAAGDLLYESYAEQDSLALLRELAIQNRERWMGKQRIQIGMTLTRLSLGSSVRSGGRTAGEQVIS